MSTIVLITLRRDVEHLAAIEHPAPGPAWRGLQARQRTTAAFITAERDEYFGGFVITAERNEYFGPGSSSRWSVMGTLGRAVGAVGCYYWMR